ncbi:MAG: Rieske 2Fe-2S domain-containing protein [Chloroherpetonaceae bacterium]|nr:Rieske 2Fe-2S domain-containing protein [Chloroherpetonaceae bacterium]MCS7210461.1 Rieske 2Fe-2S domain-containing protein [Chloroherpetonaceae bacterium]MDW8020302.1 Rieske 2Fe-2S domain-containing protein [Chloroherpetonaceae bacterium]MDW8466502.1 Rieske 2Fe-2S domain-containing protein [Chloroherpetonaceae bacterium]
MNRRDFLTHSTALAFSMALCGCPSPTTSLDTLPPAAPAAIAVKGSLFAITVSWPAVTTNRDGTPLMDLAGYRLYRSAAPARGFEPIAHLNASQTMWQDRTVRAGDIWYYKVTALDHNGNESDFSPESSPALLSIRVSRSILPQTGEALFLNYDGQVAQPTDFRSDLSITRFGESFIVLSRFCTHAGCSNMVFQEGIWTCRCHGSQFTQQGRVIAPPAQSDLRAFEFSKDDNGDLIVALC